MLGAIGLSACRIGALDEPVNGAGAAEAAASPAVQTGAAGGGGWLTGTTDERFALIADQLGGFSAAMTEVGYRYVELYWALHDGNWGYAGYQADKIRQAIELGIIRRPDRGAAAEALFLTATLPLLEEAIAARAGAEAAARFEALTASCNACHQAERVPFVRVEPPAARPSPVRAPVVSPGD